MKRVISTDRARQGRRGQRVLLILLASLALAAIAWFAAETYGESTETERTLEPAATSETPS